MNPTTTLRSSAALVAAITLLAASPASAALSAAAVDCRSSVAKNYGKLLKTTTKTIVKCHKSRNKDAALSATDCNDIAQADLKAKLPKQYGKFTDKVTADCAGLETELTAANFGGGVEYYAGCPVSGCVGVTDSVNTIAEVAACLICVAGQIPGDVGTDTLGSPAPGLSKDEQKCHAAIAKGYSKYLSAAHKVETKCQGDEDDLGNPTLDSCVDTDPKLKVSKALGKAQDGVVKKCPDDALVANLDGCANDTVANVNLCNTTEWAAAEDEAFTTTYELPATTCPSAVRTTILSRCSTLGDTATDCSSGFDSGTVLNVGWTGLAHNLGLPDAYTIAGDVTCAGTEKGSCGTCTTSGISLDNPQYQDFTRCIDDPWTECSNPFGFDAACAGGLGGQCKYWLGPPLNVSASGTPTCTLNYLFSDITGSGDPDAGTADIGLDLRAVVHLGASQTQPCPYCRDDATPQDGSRDGTCYGGGPRDGQPCDVQGFDLTFANPDLVDAPNDGVSLDCPPPPGANISGSGLTVNFTLTTGTTGRDAIDPCEAPNAAEDCYCGVCTLDPSVSCDEDTDCSGMALGTCDGGPGVGGVDRKPNNCTGFSCTPGALTDRGDCPDVDSYCSGALFAHGKGIISCGIDADCDSFVTGSLDPDDWVCPNDDCGTCSSFELRSCFLDPMSLTGTPDTENPTLVGAFCLPPSGNGSVNSSTGSPGPGTVSTDSLVELRYD